MDNSTIKIAIDLGTTNSSVAANINGKIVIVKNKDRAITTPSVFGIDKSQNFLVGRRAYENLFKNGTPDDEKNNKAEIKRLMGTDTKIEFPRLGKSLNAEDISAEILKALKADVTREYPDVSNLGAVVTIPAHFSTVQAEATKRAAILAGFQHVVLLQEPIAAAMSYGFNNSKNHNWIVYDLGGGTFDVAVITSKDGVLSCVNHSGDNFLGGKDIDWQIVDKLFVPKLKASFNLSELERNNPLNKSIFTTLKYLAEKAKIDLSEFDKCTVEIDRLGVDLDGREIYLSFEVTKNELEEIIRPLVDRTIKLTEQAINESGLNSKSIEKIVLVGGPTQIPFIREQLFQHFKIMVDTTVDPMTAVAHGACIFALGQMIPTDVIKKNIGPRNSDEVEIEINYSPLTSDSEEVVTGIIKGAVSGDIFIQLQSEDGSFSTERIKLKNGKFYESVVVQPKRLNNYWIYLMDQEGNQIKTNLDSFSITHGLTVSGAPLPSSIGVGIAKKDYTGMSQLTEVMDIFFKKNSTLPLSEMRTYKTVRKLSKGDSINALPVSVYEGESQLPDRNRRLCELVITGNQIPSDLPEGTDIDITISIDVSRVVTVDAYIPVIDFTLNIRGTLHDESVKVEGLTVELLNQEKRTKEIEKVADTTTVTNKIAELKNSIKNAESDEDEKRKAAKELLDLKADIDKLQNEKGFELALAEYEKKYTGLEEILQSAPDSEAKVAITNQFSILKADAEKAKQSKDTLMLNRIVDQLRGLSFRLFNEDPQFHVEVFKSYTGGTYRFSNQQEAEYYTKKGNQAIKDNNLEELKRCNKNLIDLMVKEDQAGAAAKQSGITR